MCRVQYAPLRAAGRHLLLQDLVMRPTSVFTHILKASYLHELPFGVETDLLLELLSIGPFLQLVSKYLSLQHIQHLQRHRIQ